MKCFDLFLIVPKFGTQLDSVPSPEDSFSCHIERDYENQTKQSPKTHPLTPHIVLSI